MDIILVRHAEREHKKPEKEDGLSANGQETAKETLKRLLRQRETAALRPFTTVFSSQYQAPRQTAQLLAEGNKLEVRDLKCLEPDCSDLSPKTLFDEADKRLAEGGDTALTSEAVLAVVGHEPSISRLLCQMTGKDSRRLDRGEAVWIRGEDKQAFIAGKAELVYATRRENFAEKLKDKIQTKMTVCTFLAGFTITALIEILKDPEAIIKTSRVAAAISFTAALGLFVAAVYVYDELSMPPEFWGSDTGEKPSGRRQFGHDARLNDNLYAYMVRAWRFLFTPAVCMSMIGFFALLFFNLRYPHLGMPPRAAVAALISGCTLGLGIAVLLYQRLRPRRLAVD
jgi:phosphohistidine phosphatase SixA